MAVNRNQSVGTTSSEGGGVRLALDLKGRCDAYASGCVMARATSTHGATLEPCAVHAPKWMCVPTSLTPAALVSSP